VNIVVTPNTHVGHLLGRGIDRLNPTYPEKGDGNVKLCRPVPAFDHTVYFNRRDARLRQKEHALKGGSRRWLQEDHAAGDRPLRDNRRNPRTQNLHYARGNKRALDRSTIGGDCGPLHRRRPGWRS